MTARKDLKPWDTVETTSGRLGVIMAADTFEWTEDVRYEVWMQDNGTFAVFGAHALEWVEGERGAAVREAYREWRDAR